MDEPDDVRELLGAYVLGHLDGTELARVELVLAGDADLRREAEQLRAVADLLPLTDADDLTDPELPAGLDDAVVAAVLGDDGRGDELEERRRRTAPVESGGSARSGGSSGSGDRGRRGLTGTWRGSGRVLGPVAAGVIGVAISLGVVLGGGTPQPGLGVEEPIAFEVQPGGLEVDARLVPHTWGTEVFLDMVGLVDGERYRVELETDDGSRVSAGTFLGDAELEVVCVMNGAVLREDVRAIVVTTSDDVEVMRSELETVDYRSV